MYIDKQLNSKSFLMVWPIVFPSFSTSNYWAIPRPVYPLYWCFYGFSPIWTNHLRQDFTIFSTIGATLTFFPMLSFQVFYCCVVKFSFKLEWYFSIIIYTRNIPPFHPPGLNPMVNIFHLFPSLLY